MLHFSSHFITLAALIALGFFLGMRHATDADHVVAVMTIVSKQRKVRPAAWIGILWGLGHSLTIFAVGAAIIFFSVVIPPRLGLSMELAVALMLILLGVLNLSGFTRWVAENVTPPVVVHSHLHSHGDIVHTHAHAHFGHVHKTEAEEHGPGAFGRLLQRLGLYNVLRPVAIGIVHGLAGSAAIALLVLTTIRNPYWAIAYLAIFGVGTMAGMMVITAAMAASFKLTSNRFARLDRHLATAAGLISFVFGCFLVYQIGFVEGLFTKTVHWTPH